MSGIVGWVDFGRDLSRERSTLLAMTATLACRGPDDEGVWVSRHCGFGHRHLAVFDAEAGRQPVVVEDGSGVRAVGMHSGSILNHAELRSRLAGLGHRLQRGGDTEVLVHAYLEWGEDCVHRLEGSFAGAVWDEQRRRLWLVRDRLGVEPLFYYPLATGVVFGSEAKAILAHPLVEAEVDADGLREVLTYSGTPDFAPFHGMSRLRAGRMAVMTEQFLSVRAYWKVEARPHTDDLDTTVSTIRGLLEESMDRNLVTDMPKGCLLSGGLDSSGVVGLAHRVLSPRGEAVRTFTVNFARHEDNFRPSDTRSGLDTPYAADVVAHLGTEHTGVLIDPTELADPVARAAVLRAKDIPTPLGDMNTSLYLLARAVSDQVRVVMTGEAADSLFHGVVWNRDPVESTMGTFPWVARGVVRDAPQGLGCGLLDPALLEKLSPLDYAAQRYRESIAEAPMLDDVSEVDRHMRELCWVHITNFMENQNGHTERLFKAVGVEVRMPYCDHRLVQYAYNLPWALQNFDGREKGLLRAALSDVLPRSVIDRRKTPYPVTVDKAYEAALRAEATALLADRQAPVLPLLDTAAVRDVLDDANSLGSWAARANLELPLQLNRWIREYGIKLSI
ncbi:asparagine synthase (glutamine-hydrolyzing) [Nocardia sp. CDC153]|uniref:asparagine synthase (glutamine-hydrolyzing) n=1 Tax=Nocardia sp. CDC153 TaxID=3112167 RepID=UPI002DB83D90|nr:asparagine synthase (glutamine-hydrolyzing) [Nocardia sp. CDC153]MEC3952029.1 asparagine synthase (glutamine-hydrolyzing) [Nocardia sp. CDC153]